jgi:hypothetical protein
MSHPQDHDDGLVHPHNFACGERGRMAERPMTTRAPEDHDDGLVHAHNYACGERGRPVHA